MTKNVSPAGHVHALCQFYPSSRSSEEAIPLFIECRGISTSTIDRVPWKTRDDGGRSGMLHDSHSSEVDEHSALAANDVIVHAQPILEHRAAPAALTCTIGSLFRTEGSLGHPSPMTFL